jgi:hypothetical protein
MRIFQICALALASLFAATGLARAERAHHLEVRQEVAAVGDERRFDPRVFLVQDRPSLDGVIYALQSRYGPGEVKSVSDTFVGRDGRSYFTVKYLTEDGQMIIVRVDAQSGQIVGGR